MDGSFGCSSKGKPTVIFATFEFTKHRDNVNGSTVWRCSKSTYLTVRCASLHLDLKLST